jgi:hypothetical protein
MMNMDFVFTYFSPICIVQNKQFVNSEKLKIKNSNFHLIKNKLTYHPFIYALKYI